MCSSFTSLAQFYPDIMFCFERLLVKIVYGFHGEKHRGASRRPGASCRLSSSMDTKVVSPATLSYSCYSILRRVCVIDAIFA